uniref:Uncharacterized protein n=1 Tax=Ixodes ricinus TaxID=34613 RepID=A0A6B0V3G7_IXORI
MLFSMLQLEWYVGPVLGLLRVPEAVARELHGSLHAVNHGRTLAVQALHLRRAPRQPLSGRHRPVVGPGSRQRCAALFPRLVFIVSGLPGCSELSAMPLALGKEGDHLLGDLHLQLFLGATLVVTVVFFVATWRGRGLRHATPSLPALVIPALPALGAGSALASAIPLARPLDTMLELVEDLLVPLEPAEGLPVVVPVPVKQGVLVPLRGTVHA